MMAAIQMGGANLKSAASRPAPEAKPAPAATGMLSMLEKAMKDRRFFVETNDDDEDSDASGFSDSDVDSD